MEYTLTYMHARSHPYTQTGTRQWEEDIIHHIDLCDVFAPHRLDQHTLATVCIYTDDLWDRCIRDAPAMKYMATRVMWCICNGRILSWCEICAFCGLHNYVTLFTSAENILRACLFTTWRCTKLQPQEWTIYFVWFTWNILSKTGLINIGYQIMIVSTRCFLWIPRIP